MPPTIRLRTCAAVLAAAMFAAGCGTRVGSRFVTPPSSTAVATTTTAAVTTTSLDVAAAKARITANWQRFFDHGTPIADREALLENGSSYAAALAARASDPRQAQATATVTDVQLTSPTQATVTYRVLLNGQVALPNAQGVAVLQDGTWKVSAQSFCSLVTLGASAPVPGCS